MVSYLILCRTLTHAQRTAQVLERAGIGSRVMRTPRAISGNGCGYCVKIAELSLSKSLLQLKKEGLGPKQVYVQTENNALNEVPQHDLS